MNLQTGYNVQHTIDTSKKVRYDTTEEFNVDSKAEYSAKSALSSTRSQTKKYKKEQIKTNAVPF